MRLWLPTAKRATIDDPNRPHEFTNQAHHPDLKPVKKHLVRWMPKQWAKSLGGRLG